MSGDLAYQRSNLTISPFRILQLLPTERRPIAREIERARAKIIRARNVYHGIGGNEMVALNDAVDLLKAHLANAFEWAELLMKAVALDTSQWVIP